MTTALWKPESVSFTINTNLPVEKIPADFCKTTSKVIADALGKPESYVAVCVTADLLMSFGGSTDPCAVCEVRSMGGVGGDVNNSHASKIFPHLSQALGLSDSRVYVEFVDVNASMMAYNGSIIA